MLYSHPKVGKTTLIGTGGSKTLIIRPPTDHTDMIVGSGAQEWVVRDWNEISDAHEYLRQTEGEWDWVWLDSISLFQDHGLDDIWDAEVARKPHRQEYGMDKGEYGRNMERLSRWVRDMAALADMGICNFGLTAHPEMLEDPATGEFRLMPYIQGRNMSPKICGYMNIIAYLEIKRVKGEERRVLRTRGTEDYVAGDQFNAFDKGRLIDPTMPKLEAKLNAARRGSKSTTTRRRPRRRKER